MPFEKKSVDTGFAPINKALKTVPILWFGIWKRMDEKQQKRSSSKNIGSVLKVWARLLGVKVTSSQQYLFCCHKHYVSIMLHGIFFLVFYYVKKMYSISTAIILNEVSIFYSPLIAFFWRWHFWLSEINVKSGREIPWDESPGQLSSFPCGALPLNTVGDGTLSQICM